MTGPDLNLGVWKWRRKTLPVPLQFCVDPPVVDVLIFPLFFNGDRSGVNRCGTPPFLSGDRLSNTVIANRYASALFDILADDDSRRTVRGELDALAEVMGDPEMQKVQANPRVKPDDKRALLVAVGERLSTSRPAMNLLFTMADNDRINAVSAVADAFGAMVDDASGRVAVTVVSALPLTNDVTGHVDRKVTEILGGEADIRHEVDDTILGGLVVRVGSKVFDNSIRHHLAQLRQGL